MGEADLKLLNDTYAVYDDLRSRHTFFIHQLHSRQTEQFPLFGEIGALLDEAVRNSVEMYEEDYASRFRIRLALLERTRDISIIRVRFRRFYYNT